MKPKAKANGKQKRARKGEGRLYKRDGQGKEHPADWNGAGVFWLAYRLGGELVRQALRDADGQPITDRNQAEAERRRIVAPLQTGSAVETLKVIAARLEDATGAHVVAVDESAPVLRILDGWQAFLDHPNRPKPSDRTFQGYASIWKRWSTWADASHPGCRFLRDVTQDQALQYARHLDGNGVTPSTFNQHVNLLRLVWRTLGEDARATVNPWMSVKHRENTRKEIARHRALTPAQFQSVIAAAEADPDIRDLLVLLAWTGQRLVDVVTMKWQSVDFANGTLEFYPRKTIRKGKRVHLPMFPQAREVLDRRQDPTKPFHMDGLVFVELADVYERDNGSTLVKRIGAVFKRAGMASSSTTPGTKRATAVYGAHSMRHYFVTQATAAGLPSAFIRRVTGHSTDEMAGHYMQLGSDFAEELSKRIGGAAESLGKGAGARDPLPSWAVALVERMTVRNWKAVKADLLGGEVRV